ncbi:MAG: hypothetical protein ACOZQL_18930 [Myxococcota bacterium]
MCGMGNVSTHLPLFDDFEFVDLSAFSPALVIANVLAALVLGGGLALVAYVALAAVNRFRRRLRPAVDPSKLPRTFATLDEPARWRGSDGTVLRSHGRAALERVFGRSPWRTLMTERALLGRRVFGVGAAELRLWLSVYLDASAHHLERAKQ